MSDHTDTQFSHGARWLRADFHLHTIKELGPSRKTYRSEFRDREGEFNSSFIAQLKAEAITVGCITNHNTFDIDEFLQLQKASTSEEILLLPGIELGIRGGGSSIHTLVVFDPKELTAQNDFISRFLVGQYPRGNPDEGSSTKDDLIGCFTCLEGLGVDYFIVFAHVDSSNGLLQVVNKTELGPQYEQIEAIWHDRVLGFQGAKTKGDAQQYCQWVSQKLPSKMPIPAFVEGSDPETSIMEVGRQERGTCYLKMSSLSFHSVKFALKDETLRVTNQSPTPEKRPLIQTLEINGGSHGFSAYRLSPDLNTLIGSRGSGKSLMIETLRWALGRESGEGDKGYKKELIHEFLGNGANVKITGKNEYGDTIVITRAYTEKTNPAPPQLYVNGILSQLSVERVFPGLLYFGQKDLGERPVDFYEQFFSQILGVTPVELSEKEETAKRNFGKQIDHYITATKAKSDDDEYKYEQDALKKKLDVFKKHGIEERLKVITAFDQDVRRFEKFKKEFPVKAVKLISVQEELSEHLKADDTIFTSEATQTFVAAWNDLKTKFDANLALLDQSIIGFREINGELKVLAEQVEKKRKELQNQFAEILREINLPELDIDEYRKMVSRHQQLAEIRKLTAERGGKLALFERELITSGEYWLGTCKAITDHFQGRIDTVNQNLPANIHIGIEFQGDRDDFKQFLRGLFYGSNFQTSALDAMVDACDSGLDLFRRRTQLIDSELSNRMGEIFQATLEAKFKEILTFSPRDARTINYDNVPINELSLGKRAMALLLLLLSLEQHPIIILDQPEDDLDNETIHRLVVQPLLKRKGSLQFIIATHNPNIPVLGDAEQVIACYEKKRREFDQQFGSLDNPKIKDAVVNIMEGGQDAFNQRHDIYSLWKKSN